MDEMLWEQARNRLAMYNESDGIFAKLRFAQEELVLKDTPAMELFACLAKLRAAGTVAVDGAINSSYVAWLMGATSVNPLAPHYHCPACGKVVFHETATTAFDLPPKQCTCGQTFLRDGHDIPADGFLRRASDHLEVSLQVATSFYPAAVEILKECFSDSYILPVRVAFKNKSFVDEFYIDSSFRPPLAEDGFWHLTYPERVSGDGARMALNIRQREQLEMQPGGQAEAVATPELARTLYEARREKYAFITDLIPDEPVDFDLLVRLMGFAHSTNGWRDNGEYLIRGGETSFRQIPAYREQILEDVRDAVGSEGNWDLEIMEQARMGKYFSMGMPEETELLLLAHDMPEWYPWYLSRVCYLCPKGHIIAVLQRSILKATCQ